LGKNWPLDRVTPKIFFPKTFNKQAPIPKASQRGPKKTPYRGAFSNLSTRVGRVFPEEFWVKGSLSPENSLRERKIAPVLGAPPGGGSHSPEWGRIFPFLKKRKGPPKGWGQEIPPG